MSIVRPKARLAAIVAVIVGLFGAGQAVAPASQHAGLAVASSAATSASASQPGPGGVVADRVERVTAFNTKVVDSGVLPGQLTMVIHEGQVVQYAEAGWADAGHLRKMQRDSLFRMYSMTKPITAVAVLQLMEEGKLLLTDPVAKYLPAFGTVKVQAGDQLVDPVRPILIRDLLTHTPGTVGLVEALSTPGLVALDVETPMAVLVDRIAALPLRSQPGSRFEYGFGLDIAGVVVEVVSGQTLDEYMREHIFEPLGMHDTAFYVPAAAAARLVAEQTKLPDGSWADVPPGVYSSDKLGARREHFGGGGWGGGVVSTIDDYARFARTLLAGGTLDGHRIISRKSVELMTTNHTGDLPTIAGPGYGHGLGVGVRTDLTSAPVLGSVGRFGWSGAGLTLFLVDPTEDLIALRFTNVLALDQREFAELNPTFETLVYQALA